MLKNLNLNFVTVDSFGRGVYKVKELNNLLVKDVDPSYHGYSIPAILSNLCTCDNDVEGEPYKPLLIADQKVTTVEEVYFDHRYNWSPF